MSFVTEENLILLKRTSASSLDFEFDWSPEWGRPYKDTRGTPDEALWSFMVHGCQTVINGNTHL